MDKSSWRVLGLTTLLGTSLFGASATASTITTSGYTIYDTFNFLDARTANTAGISQGTRISFGADLSPVGTQTAAGAGANGTTVTAQQTAGSYNYKVPYLFSPALPDEFYQSIDFSSHPNLTGAWNLTLSNKTVNGGAPVIVQTAPLATTTPPPFVQAVTMQGGGLTPTINWVIPNGYIPDAETVYIFDTTHLTPAGYSPLIFTSNPSAPLSPTATSFTIPSNILQSNTNYAFAVQLDQRSTRGDLLARSRSFVSLHTLPSGVTGQVYLPVVGVDTNPNDNLGAPYQFNFNVLANSSYQIDPQVAVGYEYQIGAGDPLFSSVTLPDIGNLNGYLVCPWDGSAYGSCQALDALKTFDFGSMGVSRFKVLGIEPGLDPSNTTAFVTTLTFAGSGQFTGTMTPILANVPEPRTIGLFCVGLLLAGILGMQRRIRSQSIKY